MTKEPDREYRRLLAELTSTLANKTRAAARHSVALRDAVCEYVSVEHTKGTPLAEVIQTVKEILRKAEAGAAQTSDDLAQQLIDWCHEFHPGGSAAMTPAAEPVS